jgi:hypothetical protein
MRILSVDPANKSLAISIIDFNSNWKDDLINIKLNFDSEYAKAVDVNQKISILWIKTQAISALMDNLFYLKYINVFDLLPDQKVNFTSTESRIGRLKGVIAYVKKINNLLVPSKHIEHVLVERQLSQKNMEVSSALIYAFTKPDFDFIGKSTHFPVLLQDLLESQTPIISVHMVGASLKSKVYFGDDGRIQNFRKKYMSNYNANKAHSKYNLLKWLKMKNCMNFIKGIPNDNMDDIADSFLMGYAWCIKTYKVN